MVARPKRDLAGATLILMAAFVASRATGLLRNIVIGYQFGTSPEYAAYLAGNRIPDFVFQIMAGGAVASAFIPVFTSYLARDERDEGWRVVSSLFNVALLALTPICAALIIFAPQVIGIIAPGFDADLQTLASNLARVMLLSPIFFTLGCFSTSVLNSHQRFFLAALAPTVYNLSIVAGALLLGTSMGVYGLAIGSAAGALLFFLIQVPGLMGVKMAYQPILELRNRGVREVGKLMAPRALGMAATQINFLVALVLASGMAELYAALDYAWILTMLPLGVFAMAISTAVFPTLAEQHAREQTAELRRVLISSLRIILYFTIPASIGLIVLRFPIITLLLQRGEFTAESTAATAYALQFYAAGLVALAIIEIVSRAFYALHDTKTPVLAAIGAMVVNVALAVALVQYLSHGGLALAATISSVLQAVVMLYLLRGRIGDLEEGQLLRSVSKMAGSAVAMGIGLYYFASFLGDQMAFTSLLNEVVFVGASVAFGGGLYFAISAALGCEEIAHLRRFLPVRR